MENKPQFGNCVLHGILESSAEESYIHTMKEEVHNK